MYLLRRKIAVCSEYAGGILSAGVDGIRVAEAVALDIAGRGGEPACSSD
jgi:hypothetical protein